jgi:hypothetical protein
LVEQEVLVKRNLAFVLAVVMAGAVAGSAHAEGLSRQQPSAFSRAALTRAVQQSGRQPAEAGRRDGASPSSRKGPDSILNGGLIGAAIGGVAGSFLIVAAAGGSDDVPRAMLNVSVGPAAGGFALGALLDALH